jgi:hypothetical protein
MPQQTQTIQYLLDHTPVEIRREIYEPRQGVTYGWLGG